SKGGGERFFVSPVLPDRASARPAYNEGELAIASLHLCDRHCRFGTLLELRSPIVPKLRSSLICGTECQLSNYDPRASISRAESVLVSSIAGIAADLFQIT